MKILIIQLRQLGDILLTTPVLKAIKDELPGAVIDFMTYPMGRLILDGNPMVRKHIIAPQKGVVAAARFLTGLRSEQYDVVLDFMATPRSAVFARLVPAKQRIAFETNRAFLFTTTLPRSSADQYIVTEKFELLKPLSLHPTDIRLILPTSKKDQSFARQFMNSNPKLASSKLRVVLSPTHRRAERRWPLERWAELAVWLEQYRIASVIWAWGPGEEDVIDSVMAMAPNVGVKCPKTTFRELAAIISESHLFIGNSNGPSHVAVAMDTPSIQLHGPTRAVSWCPLTERHRAVQASDMAGISVTDVMRMIEN